MEEDTDALQRLRQQLLDGAGVSTGHGLTDEVSDLPTSTGGKAGCEGNEGGENRDNRSERQQRPPAIDSAGTVNDTPHDTPLKQTPSLDIMAAIRQSLMSATDSADLV